MNGRHTDLPDYVIFAVLLFYTLRMAGLFALRRSRQEMNKPYRAFGYPVLPSVYISTAGMIEVLLGAPVYLIWRKENRTNGKLAGPKAAEPTR